MARSIFHYLFAVAVLSIYGARVCPYIETLPTASWMSILAAGFLAAFLARTVLTRTYVEGANPFDQSKLQLRVDGLAFLGTAIAVGAFNMAAYSFPPESGLKVVVGTVILGLFASIDLALERERKVVEAIAASGERPEVPGGDYFPLTAKFSLFALALTLSMAGVVMLLMFRDLEFLSHAGPEGLASARRAVLIELFFVGAVFLMELANLIFGFSKNLKIKLSDQNNALSATAREDFGHRVSVHTFDEFGEMGTLTNTMIESLKGRTEQLKTTRDVTILALASLAETRDNETGAHILRTQHYVKLLAEKLRTHPRFKAEIDDDETVDLLFKSAPLHDIGKVGVPDAILLKPGKHTEEESRTMKLHTTYGRDALAVAEAKLGTNSFLKFGREIAYTHHEKWDGTGYPSGLKGEEIPVSGRLMAVADVFDALVSKRVYKPALTIDATVAIMKKDSGTHFDPDIVEAFLGLLDEFSKIQARYKDPHDSEAVDYDPREVDGQA